MESLNEGKKNWNHLVNCIFKTNACMSLNVHICSECLHFNNLLCLGNNKRTITVGCLHNFCASISVFSSCMFIETDGVMCKPSLILRTCCSEHAV